MIESSEQESSLNQGIRLQKYLAMCGIGSRRRCETLITDSRVSVNGAVVSELGSRVGTGDTVTLDGREVKPETERVVILYHKPMGEIVTSSDPMGRATVMDHFRDYPLRLYPIGRLDYDSEGLLLLTNDGALTERLLHPRHEVAKTYLTRVAGDMTETALTSLRKGVDIGDGLAAPADAHVIRRTHSESVLLMTIHEGRNRQVRRMCEAVGFPVTKLRRVQFGPIQLGELKRGQWRELTVSEVQALGDAVRL
ncbi:pseudouridine synthase [Clostridia bacterium]|nr:pseudouridine synthase [Clostridia bacterium]